MIHPNGTKFYLTEESACDYLANKKSTSIITDPNQPLTTPLYTLLAENGFRRSGNIAYRPNCHNCQACIPVRISTSRFKPSRSQQRNMKKNQDLHVSPHPAVFSDEHFSLYRQYLAQRHSDSSMNKQTKDDYLAFLTCQEMKTIFYEFRLKGLLIAVAITDILENALSAVYTFYHPDFAMRGLGTYAILWQHAQALSLQMEWLYLGFWIEKCPQMAYKTNFQPIEGIQDQRWQPIRSRVY